MALASSTNSLLFEEALIPVFPPLGPLWVLASILSFTRTHTHSAKHVNTHTNTNTCSSASVSPICTLCMTGREASESNFHAGCISCDTIAPWPLSGPLQMFENILYSLCIFLPARTQFLFYFETSAEVQFPSVELCLSDLLRLTPSGWQQVSQLKLGGSLRRMRRQLTCFHQDHCSALKSILWLNPCHSICFKWKNHVSPSGATTQNVTDDSYRLWGMF